MFTRMITWFVDLFPKSESTVEGLLKAFAESNEDVMDYIESLEKAINSDQKQFLIEVTVGPDTKMRPLKAGIEDLLSKEMPRSNPECTDWVVKSYYHRANG